ncbi:MAG: chloride channel protein [Pseudomonadota bacterium]
MSDSSANIVSRVVRILLFGGIVGFIASMASIALVESIKLLFEWLIPSTTDRISSAPSLKWEYLVYPVVGGLIVGLLLHLKSQKPYHTLADLIGAVQADKTGLPLKDNLRMSLAAVISMGSGASVGPYGPVATMGGYLGASICRLTRTQRNLGIGCGVAAAIATAFNAPLAGIVFAHEVILRHYSLRAFAPITVAASTGFFVSYFWLERPALLEMSATRSIFAPEFLGFVVVGICGALVAIVFMRLVQCCFRWAHRTAIAAWLRPAVAGLAIGVIAQWIPETLGVGSVTTKLVLVSDLYGQWQIMALMLAKIVATAICLGFGFAGGIFSPSLLIGLLMGALLGNLADVVLLEQSSGVVFYAICGMMAVTSPIIGAPLTAILIVFELTHNYDLTTAVMISVVFSNVVAYRLYGRSYFDQQLKSRGIDLSLGQDPVVLQQVNMSEFLRTDFVALEPDQSVEKVIASMAQGKTTEGYVLDTTGRLTGKVVLSDLVEHYGDNLQDPVQLWQEEFLRFEIDTSVWEAMEDLRREPAESVPIVDQQGYITGIVRPVDVINAYLERIHGVRSEAHASD